MAQPSWLEKALRVARDHYHWRNAALVVLGSIASAIIQNNAVVPYVWVWSLWFLMFVALFVSGARPFKRVVWFNIAFVFLALAVAEAYLSTRWHEFRTHRETTSRLTTDDEVLGYAPEKNRTVNVKGYMDQQLVYDVMVTIDENGLRTSRPVKADEDAEGMVTFGGSFTFGAGVHDQEPWPALVEWKSGGRLRVYNFAYTGYGPHQMLAALEAGLVGKRLKHKPRYAIYLAIGDHVRRAAGMASWDGHGPRFVLNEEGEVVRRGFFDDDRLKSAAVKLGDSEVLRRFITPSVGAGEIALFAGIVGKAAKTFEERFPGSEFHVIVWDVDTFPLMAEVMDLLKKRNLRVHRISHIITDIVERRGDYRIHQHDRHPNKRAHERIAEYVSSRIVRRKS